MLKEIGIISPASSVLSLFPIRVEQGVYFLKKKGIKTVFGNHAFNSVGYTSSSVTDRIADFHGMLSNPTIDVIMASIGGYNSNQLLSEIDYHLVSLMQKAICGYSDISALLMSIYAKTRQIVFHGPTFLPEICEYPEPFDYTWKYFVEAVSRQPISYQPPDYCVTEFVDWNIQEKKRAIRRKDANDTRWQVANEGMASGVIIGGNLSTLINILGSEYLPYDLFDNKILFLEECNTTISKFDSLMQGLMLQGIFRRIAGLIIGKFDKSEMNNDIKLFLQHFLKTIPCPVIYNIDLGHTDPMITIPIGARCYLECCDTIKFEVTEY